MTLANNADAQIEGLNWDDDVAVFWNDPSIRNYLDIRACYPEKEPPQAVFMGIDPLYAMRDDLEKWGIDLVLVASVMDADRQAVDMLSIKLLSLIDDRQRLTNEGNTTLQSRGISVPNSLVDYLIVIMFEAMEQYDEPHAVGALNFLVRQRLGGARMAMHQSFKKNDRKSAVVALMASAKRLGWNTSLREMAKICKVQPSSISRLFKPGELEELILDYMNQPPVDLLPFEEDEPMMRALHRNVREQHP